MKVRNGTTASKLLIKWIGSLKHIQEVTFIQYELVPSARRRSVPDLGQYQVILKKQRVRGPIWIPDYEVAVAAQHRDWGRSLEIWANVARHDTNPENRYRIPVSRDKINTEYIKALQRERKGYVLAVSSLVRIESGHERHIPMMDFQCPVEDALYLDYLIAGLKSFAPAPGVILDSGRSYHYYGCALLTSEEWRKFLGQCLLLVPLTDIRYVGHRLFDGECVLRIGQDPEHPKVPRVVRSLRS